MPSRFDRIPDHAQAAQAFARLSALTFSPSINGGNREPPHSPLGSGSHAPAALLAVGIYALTPRTMPAASRHHRQSRMISMIGRKRTHRIAAWGVALLVGVICAPVPTRAQASAGNEWREFQGTWTAVGKRQGIPLGGDRRASIADFNGSLMLTGPSRPALGFRAEAIVLNDSVTGMAGRAVWTDERGDQVFSELRGEATATGNRLFGTFLGGTGRYTGATGSYEFSWRFLLEDEDGTVQGQSMGLKGQLRAVAPPGVPSAGSSRS